MRKVRIHAELRIALAVSAALLAALLAWLSLGEPAISRDSLYLEGLSRTLWSHPFWVWIKRDYSITGDIVHREFSTRPLYPILLRLLAMIGVTSWKRTAWIAAAAAAAWVPAWTWAFLAQDASAQPQPARPARGLLAKPALLAALIATALLLLQGESGIWTEIRGGSPYPLCILVSIGVYGLYVRERYVAAGILGGIAFLLQSDMELLMAALAALHLLRGAARPSSAAERPAGSLLRSARDLARMLGAFAVVIAPWSIGSLVAGNSFGRLWLSEVTPVYLQGLAAKQSWFADTDSGLGHFGGWQEPWILWDQFSRNRWIDLASSVMGKYFGEAAMLGIALCLGAIDWLRRPGRRAAAGFALCAAIAWVAALAGWLDTFEIQRFLVVNSAIAAWLALVVADGARADSAWPARAAGALAVVVLLIGNAGALAGTVRPPEGRSYQPYPEILALGRELEGLGAPALLLPGEAESAELGSGRASIAVLPANFKDAGELDQLIDRFGIRWTTAARRIEGLLKRHELVPRAASNGYPLWEIRPLPGGKG